MISTKPYLVRAIFEWCMDQGFTPYLTVVVDARTRVPREFVRNGEIVLNVGPDATHQLLMGNDEITFQARFNGVAFPVVVPMEAVQAIYAKENGQGMGFEVLPAAALADVPLPDEAPAAEVAPGEESKMSSAPAQPPSGKPHLTRVK